MNILSIFVICDQNFHVSFQFPLFPISGNSIAEVIKLVLLKVYRYAEYHFVLVEKTKSAKNIWEPVFEEVIVLGFFNG